MAFGNMGMGFLPTDPRKKKGPTGGSSHAAQPIDSSVINTGDPSSGSMGFASNAALGGGLFSDKSGIAPPPDWSTAEKTAEETREYRESRGVATSHKNMGSLAVDFRASEKAKEDAGEQTVRGARAAKVLDARAADEHKRTVLDPAASEMAKFRAQAAASQKYMNKYMVNMDEQLQSGKARDSTPRSNGGILAGRNKKSGGSTKGGISSGLRQADRSKNSLAPDHSWLLPELNKEFQEYSDNPDILALGATREHSAAPNTMAKDWDEMAHSQSASGKATPGELAQAAATNNARNQPNK